MSRYTEQAFRTATWMGSVHRLLGLALDHAEAWAKDRTPLATETRGGSSSPREVEERQEADGVQRMAREALTRVPELLRSCEKQAYELYQIAIRLTATVNPDKLPAEDPECSNCRKSKQVGPTKIGDHFALADKRYKNPHLCRFCGDHLGAEGELPPVEACDLYHVQSPQAAGRWLARQKNTAA